MKLVKAILTSGILFILFVIFTHQANAATITWDGGGGADTNWSTGANWTGTPDNTAPTSADAVVFNGTSTNNSTVDAGFGGSIGSLTITSAYSGTITLARSLNMTAAGTAYSQAGGIFNASSQTFDVDNAFSLTGGTYTASSGTTFIGGNFTVSGSPTFSANGGTVTFDGSTATLSCNNVTFNLVTFTHTAGAKTVSSNCSIPLGANPPIIGTTASASIVLAGTLSGSGTLRTSGNLNMSSGGTLSGFSGLVMGGGITINGATADFGSYAPFETVGLTLTTGTFTAPSGTWNLSGSFTYTSGTFNHNNGTIVVGGTSFNFASTADLTFYNINKSNAVTNVTPTLSFAPGRTITILGNLTAVGTLDRRGFMALKSTTTGVQVRLNVTGGRVLTDLQVQDINNVSGTLMTGIRLVDFGNNIGFDFSALPLSTALDYPGGDSHITNTRPTFRWKKAVSTSNGGISKYELYVDNGSTGDFYIDGILPSILDNKTLDFGTYTLRDDGDYLNLTTKSSSLWKSDYNDGALTLGKKNWRIVTHDSAGNVKEDSLDFYVDALATPKPVAPVYQSIFVIKSTPAPEPISTPVPAPTSTAAPTFTPEPTETPVVATNSPSYFYAFAFGGSVILLVILLVFLFVLRRRKQA